MKGFYPPTNPALLSALPAVFLSYYYNESRSLDILQEARKAYSSALVVTSKALHSREVAAKNSTFATVLFLDLFENFITEGPTFTTKHLDGALTLLKIRGTKQFKDSMNLAMFRHLGSMLIPSYLSCGVRPSDVFLHLRSKAASYTNTEDLEWQLEDIMLELSSLKSSLGSGEIGPLEAQITAKDLDARFVELTQTMAKTSDFGNILERHGNQLTRETNPKQPKRPNRTAERERNLELVRQVLDELLSKASALPV